MNRTQIDTITPGSTVRFTIHDYRGVPCGFLAGEVVEKRTDSIWAVRVDLGRNDPPHNMQIYNVPLGDIVETR